MQSNSQADRHQLQAFLRDDGGTTERLLSSGYTFTINQRPVRRVGADARVRSAKSVTDAAGSERASSHPRGAHHHGGGRFALPQEFAQSSDESSSSGTESLPSGPPSLVDDRSSTDPSSLDTGLASLVTGVMLLNANGEPEISRGPKPLQCPFDFLDCHETFDDVNLWKEHSWKYFFNKADNELIEPPHTSSCPLCAWCVDLTHHPARDRGWRAWNMRMNHVANEHHDRGESLGTRRPDFHLIHWLRSKKLISSQRWRFLMDDHKRRLEDPGATPSAHPVVEQPERRRRRERARRP